MLKIERTGGLAGFGAPGSHIASRGEIASDSLSAQDRQAIEILFKTHKKNGRSKSLVRDGFSYRISRTIAGVDEIIEVPETEIPAALIQCVKDELI